MKYWYQKEEIKVDTISIVSKKNHKINKYFLQFFS